MDKWWNTDMGAFLLLCLALSSCSISHGIETHGLCVSNCTYAPLEKIEKK